MTVALSLGPEPCLGREAMNETQNSASRLRKLLENLTDLIRSSLAPAVDYGSGKG